MLFQRIENLFCNSMNNETCKNGFEIEVHNTINIVTNFISIVMRFLNIEHFQSCGIGF